MQIRLTVLGPRSGHTTRACDVLVTAPAGTALATVAGSLAAAVAGSGADVGTTGGSAPVVLYAGTERLDPQRAALGEPPLIDGAVLSLQGPGPAPAHGLPHGSARLRVVSGPDAGGVHLLHGGQVRVGRSADADVPLDDPDVSRLHCAVTVEPGGAVYVADLRSTNGTAVDGTELGDLAVPLPPGALLRVGESALRLQAPPRTPDPALTTTPDGEGHLRVAPGGIAPEAAATGETAAGVLYADAGRAPSNGSGPTTAAPQPTIPDSRFAGGSRRQETPLRGIPTPAPGGHHATTHAPEGIAPHAPGQAADGLFPPAAPATPLQGPAPTAYGPGDADALGAAYGTGRPTAAPGTATGPEAAPSYRTDSGAGFGTAPIDGQTHGGQQSLVPPDPAGPRKSGRRGGLGAWARRLAGGRPAPEEQQEPAPQTAYRAGTGTPPADEDRPAAERPGAASGPTAFCDPATPDRWPDAAGILLTALGPGPRLWERGPDHPDALTVRLGTAERDGGRTAAPVVVELRRAGALGLAGPRGRLVGLARSAAAQLAALHSPGALEIVLVSTDRARPVEERVADWSWLGWLPHVRPARGQDCRLLLAYDKEQAAARTAELVRRLDDGPLGPGWPSAERAEVAAVAARHQGPHTLLIVDGDPGSSALRETTARLAAGGPAAGIHVLCLAETPAASPAFPLAATYEAARAASPAFGECGAVAVLSGDVATALRVVQPGSGPNGTVATVDAVSAAWAERFARALAPLREAEASGRPGGPTAPRVAIPLPESARLLDELGLARATPASLMARWAAAQDTDRPGAAAVLGAGPHGPVVADLAADGAHLLVEGAPATGKTELLRSLAASLAAADRPDRLSVVLVDGAGSERGEGLRACTELPHVTTHLAASDPVRMREFAQALSSELKRRAEILAGTPFTEWRTKHLPAPRIIAPRRSTEGSSASTPSPSPTAAASASPPPPASPSVTSTPPTTFTTSNESQEQITLRNRCRNKEGGSGAQADPAADPTRTGTLRLRTRPDAPAQAPDRSRDHQPAHPDHQPAHPDHRPDHQAAPRQHQVLQAHPTPSAGTGAAAPASAPVPAPAAAPDGPSTAEAAARAATPMPRLFVLVDDFDALVSPALGSTGRPAAGSVVRALEAVARDGAALGVHLIAATGHPGRTEGTATAERATLHVQLGAVADPAEDAPDAGSEPAPPGRGRLHRVADGMSVPFQAGRVTGRIPRTSTLRPTVVPLEWARMGDPPARRPLRELGNGPTDLALLASALQRAAQSSGATPGPSLM